MKLFLTAILDEDFRKQVQKAILDQARAVARTSIDEAVKAEIVRVAKNIATNAYERERYFKTAMTEAVKELIESHWDGIKAKVDELIEAAANRVVAQKLKDKTVFEAAKQDEYMRKVVRSELKKIWFDGEKLKDE